ncbi:hypothetical protein MY1884_005964 [Beauveria asiatica]
MSASPTPPHQQGSSQEPAEAIITPKLPLEKPILASKLYDSSRRTFRRLPCASGLSERPSVTTSQRTCSQRSSRIVARPPGGRLPSEDLTKNLPNPPNVTLEELCQYSSKPLLSPFVVQDISGLARQLPEPYSQPLFSAASDATKKQVLEHAQAFFSKRGRSLQECKNIVEKQQDDKSSVAATIKALRIHSMVFPCLRDHLVECTKHMPVRTRLLPLQAKLMMAKARHRFCPGMKRSDVIKEVTEELDHGGKYISFKEAFSTGTITRLNHKCSSSDLEGEGAKSSKQLEDLAGNGELNAEVWLEIYSGGYFLWSLYHHHLALFPDGCGGQNCSWSVRLHNDQHPPSLNPETCGNESTASPMISLDTTAPGKHNMALLTTALAKEASLWQFFSRSGKRPSSSDDWPASTKKQQNAANSRPMDANYEAQLDTGTTGDAIHDSCSMPSNGPSRSDSETVGQWDDSDPHLLVKTSRWHPEPLYH